MERSDLTIPSDSQKLETLLKGVILKSELLDYIEFLILPSEKRAFGTDKEYAIAKDIDENTLSEWKKRPYFWDIVSERRMSYFRSRTSDVLNMMYESAAKLPGREGATDRANWVKYVEGIPDKSENKNDNITKEFIITRGTFTVANENTDTSGSVPGASNPVAGEGN